MTSTTPATGPSAAAPSRHPGGCPGPVTGVPGPDAVARLLRVLCDHPCWSVFWDKRSSVWRVADDDPDSGLYAESSDADTVISYIQAHG